MYPPLERLAAEINPLRDASRTPFFQLMFNYKNIPGRPVNFESLAHSAYELDMEVAPFDLTLELAPQEDRIPWAGSSIIPTYTSGGRSSESPKITCSCSARWSLTRSWRSPGWSY